MKNLPIICLKQYLNKQATLHTASKIRQICKSTGFFYIQNHGVPQRLQKSIMKSSESFFNLPLEQKMKIRMGLGGNSLRGYFKFGEEITSGKIDHKQGIFMGKQHGKDHPMVIDNVPTHGENLYPQLVPSLKDDVKSYLKEMGRVGDILMQAIAESLNLDPSFFRESFTKDHTGFLQFMHYPYMPEVASDEQKFGVGEHTDYGLLTILMVSDRGLQVKNVQDQWIKVQPIPNTFVINIGDILQKMTKGLYKSTPHRVRNTIGKSRFSIPYFYDPGWDQQIKELNFKINFDEASIIERARQYKRWDNVRLQEIKGTYGDYYIKNYTRSFPQLAQRYLAK